MDVKSSNKSAEVLRALERARENALEAIGMTAERHAKKVLTDTVYNGDKPYKLTGRLRNSVTYATKKREGKSVSYNYQDANTGTTITTTEQIRSGADDDCVYVGTNVEYALGIEIGTHRKAGAVHFLQKSVTEPKDEFKKLYEDALKSVEK